MAKTVQFSKSVVYLLIVATLSTLILQNGLYWVICLSTLLIIIRLLWRPFVPGIFLFCMLYQWMQVFATVAFATFMGETVNFRSPHNGTAILCGLVGVVVVSYAMSLMLNRFKGISLQELKSSSRFISPRKVLILYIILYFFAGFVQRRAFGLAGLTQILYSLYQLKWVFYMLYAYLMLLGLANKRHFVLIFFFEFFSGFYSYFSNFKDPLYYFLIVYITFVTEFDMKKFIRLFALSVVLAVMFIMWTHIKGSYREFLRGAEQQQVVNVTQEQAFGKLQELVTNGMSKEDIELAIAQSIFRVEYTYHFALTMDRVPALLPHEYGGMMLGSLLFVTTPRFLNPNKGMFDASAKTRKYTGINYAGADVGVSISLGYFTEAYIDFGYIGMFVPLFLIGLFVGYVFLFFVKEKGINPAIAFSLTCAVVIHFQAFETDSTIIFGRLLLNFIVFAIIIRYFMPIISEYLRD
jgi:hypothetical protein